MTINVETVNIVQVPSWAEFGWLRHGFSTRVGGVSTLYSKDSAVGELNLGFTKDDDPNLVRSNRQAFLHGVAGNDAWETVTLRQVHGTEVRRVEGDQGVRTANSRALMDADGLMTQTPGIMLAVQVADCVPVLVADVKRRIVAGFHAGWRGTAAGIVEQGIARMVEEMGADPADMVGAVGPSIGACCYTVGDDVLRSFAARFGYASELFSGLADGVHLDLAEANRRQLIGAGLGVDHAVVIGECTACARVDGRRKYFSHRAEKGFTGRSMGMIGIEEE